MDKVVALFEEFRENHISYDDLYTALIDRIQRDNTFRHQAIPTLDQVQQNTPIPITHYISLRSKLNEDIQHFVPTSNHPSDQPGPDEHDPDATLITELPGETTSPNAKANPNLQSQEQPCAPRQPTIGASDPTLLASHTEPTGAVEDPDEATMIMPAGTLNKKSLNHTENNEFISNEDETLVTTHPTESQINSAETLVGESQTSINNFSTDNANKGIHEIEEDNEGIATLVGDAPNDGLGEADPEEAATLVGDTPPPQMDEPNPPPQSAQANSGEHQNPPPPQASKQKYAAIAGGLVITVTVAILLLLFLRSTPNNTTPPPSAVASDKDNNIWGDKPSILESPTASAPTSVAPAPVPSIPVSIEDETIERDTITEEVNATEDMPSNNQSSNVDSIAAADVQPPETVQFSSIAEEADHLYQKILKADKAQNLVPAEKVGTATYYLVKLIKLSPNSPLISKARSRIAKSHLALANIAREEEDWDQAQQHIDDAFNVRLPDSYQ